MAEDLVTVEGATARAALPGGRDLRPLLRQIGALLTARVQQAWPRQGRKTRWPARKNPNYAGIIADLADGPSVPARRFEDRPALVDTGRLRGSIDFRLVGSDAVEVGTNVAYAGLHHRGGRSTLEVTPTVKANLRLLLRQRPDLVPRLRWILGFDRYTVEVPARPLVEVTDRDLADVRALTVRHFQGG